MTVTATIHTPPPDPEPDRRVVTLTMPYDVAVTLLNLTHVIGGDLSGSYRQHTELVQNALYGADVRDAWDRFKGCADAQPLPLTK